MVKRTGYMATFLSIYLDRSSHYYFHCYHIYETLVHGMGTGTGMGTQCAASFGMWFKGTPLIILVFVVMVHLGAFL